MKNFTLVIIFTAFAFIEVSAQSTQPFVINSSGGEYNSDTYSYEWSIGELALVNEMKESSGSYILTNGFLQPYSKKASPSQLPASFKSHEFRLLHNPAKNVIGFMLSTNQRGKLRLKVYDERGYVQRSKEISVVADITTENINILNCANGNYFLKVEFISTDGGTRYKEGAFKFIKVH